jgi:hypothetical protein
MATGEQNHGPLIIVSGPAHCGKTSLVAGLLPRLARQGWRVAGILAEGHRRNNRRISGWFSPGGWSPFVTNGDCRRTRSSMPQNPMRLIGLRA